MLSLVAEAREGIDKSWFVSEMKRRFWLQPFVVYVARATISLHDLVATITSSIYASLQVQSLLADACCTAYLSNR